MKAIFENIPSRSDTGLTVFLYEEDRFNTPWHYHPQYELTLILEGQGMRYVGNNVSSFEQGDFVLLGSNLPHCWRMSEQFKGKARSVVMQWNSNIIAHIPEMNNINALLQKSERGLRLSDKIAQRHMDAYIDLLKRDSVGKYLYFLNIMHLISKETGVENLAGESYRINTSNDTSTRLETIYSFLNTNYNRKIAASEVAALVHMTPESFSRFFSTTMEKPFFAFLNEYRVNRASRMLIETDHQVAEIAFSCGYESLPFFYKQFKKYKNYSPTNFRKEFQRSL